MKITVHKNKSSSFVYEDMICRMIRWICLGERISG